MAKLKITAAILKVGELGTLTVKLDEDQHLRLVQMMRDSKGELFNLDVAPWSPRRSVGQFSQSNAFHGNCRRIAQETGNTMEAVKSCVLVRAAEELSYPGDDVGGVFVPRPDSDATQEEATLLIRMSEVIAMEEGVSLLG